MRDVSTYTAEERAAFRRAFAQKRRWRSVLFLLFGLLAAGFVAFLVSSRSPAPLPRILPVVLALELPLLAAYVWVWRCPACRCFLGTSVDPVCRCCGIPLGGNQALPWNVASQGISVEGEGSRYTEEETREHRRSFAVRRRRRTLGTVAFAVGVLLLSTSLLHLTDNAPLRFGLAIVACLAMAAGLVFALWGWRCPACGEALGREDRQSFCRSCGARLQ